MMKNFDNFFNLKLKMYRLEKYQELWGFLEGQSTRFYKKIMLMKEMLIA